MFVSEMEKINPNDLDMDLVIYVTILEARRFCKMVTLAFSLAVSEVRMRFVTFKFAWLQNHLLFGL